MFNKLRIKTNDKYIVDDGVNLIYVIEVYEKT